MKVFVSEFGHAFISSVTFGEGIGGSGITGGGSIGSSPPGTQSIPKFLNSAIGIEKSLVPIMLPLGSRTNCRVIFTTSPTGINVPLMIPLWSTFTLTLLIPRVRCITISLSLSGA
jgi:hypothetical protein